ncbi:MAG: EAL domain-containing protein [Arthrospira sp. PLM2.Bin9]|nr:EAL domain-containing protein [Arthrospira sp. PLM2.Bin9]TVU54076.1 MAG: EAL domain-containing protein [Arthrospira sp. PLM2.Bin9]
MPENSGLKTQEIKSSIINGSALGLLLISTVIAILSLVPLYNRLKNNQEKQLIFEAQNSASIINSFIDKYVDKALKISQQPIWITSNTELLTDNLSNISPQALENTRQIWQDSLSDSLTGIAYINAQKSVVLEVGESIPREVLNKPKMVTYLTGGISELFTIDNIPHIMIEKYGELNGSHIFLVNLSYIQNKLPNNAHFYQSDSLELAILPSHQFASIFILNYQPSQVMEQLGQEADILEIIQRNYQRGTRTGGLWCISCDAFIAYSPIGNLEASLIMGEKKRNLYSPVYRQILLLSGTMMLFIMVGTTCLVLTIRPLTNQISQEILERHKAEAELIKEKNFTQTLLEANPAFFIVLDVEGKVKFMNPSMLHTLGYKQEEVEGMNYSATFVPKEEGKSAPWVFELMINRRLPIRTEETMITKDDREIIVEWYGRAVFNKETDEYEYFVGAGLDITDRKRADEEIQLLQQITHAVTIAVDFDSALAVALDLLCQTTNWEFGEAWIPHPEQTHLEYSLVSYQEKPDFAGFYEESKQFLLGVNDGLAGRVWASQEPEWDRDISEESQANFSRYSLIKKYGFKAGLGVPILADDRVLAVLVFLMSTPREQDNRLVKLVSSVAMQLGSVFQRKQAEEKYRDIFENALEGIFQIDLQGKYISANPALAKIFGYESQQQLLVRGKQIKSVYADPETYNRFINLLQTKGSVSNFEAQVYRRDGQSIWIWQNARALYSDRHDRVLYYEGSIMEITHLKETEAKLRHSASHDSLTDLWNRAFFLDKLNDSLRKCKTLDNYQFAILFLDLDGFQFINDSLGHAIGDQLLIEISKRLTDCVDSHILARLGGDEFTILLENITDIQEAIDVAERIQEALKLPIFLGDNQIFTGASIGIVEGNNSNYESSPEVLRDADTAMYRAKRQGKGCYVVFDSTMRTNALRRLYLQTQLRLALQEQQFELNYQPIIELSTGTIAGFEALLRWDHPQEGLISPAEFIPIAEEAGLIVDIGEWVLRQACFQLSEWKDKFAVYSNLMMSVNLSSQQFTNDLGRRISNILVETGVAGSELKLEITETAIMNDPELAIATLQQLKQQQIKICIDDFGTGYCSLGYLHKFPVDILKIDRSFVSQIPEGEDKREIVRVIVALAESLKMDAIAEGIETAEQLHHLQKFNCKYGQGYFFFRPLNRQAVEALLNHAQIGLPLPSQF